MQELKFQDGQFNFDASEWVSDLGSYFEAISTGVEILEKQIKDFNLMEVRLAAKFLKDASKQVGIVQMAYHYENLEKASSSIDVVDLNGLYSALDRIRSEIPSVEEQINAVKRWSEDA